jgi:cell wall-associated NlpC family hydrolase
VIFDTRITPIRRDLASTAYKAIVKRKKYVTAKLATVKSAFTPLYSNKGSKLSTQLLYGEECDVFETKNGWSWIQSRRDNYVGYTPTINLTRKIYKPNSKVISLRTVIYTKPDIKSVTKGYLSFNSLVEVIKIKGKYSLIKNLGWCPSLDLVKIKSSKFNHIDLSKQYLDTPYLWGGRDSMGIDCSGLVQNLHQINNRPFPRDTDMQEMFVTNEVKYEKDLKAGDLVFWKGHVAMMIDNSNIIHANAFHMKTAIEPLSTAKKRILKSNGKIKKLGRL